MILGKILAANVLKKSYHLPIKSGEFHTFGA